MVHFHEVLTKYSMFNFWKREYTKDKRDINIDNVWNTSTSRPLPLSERNKYMWFHYNVFFGPNSIYQVVYLWDNAENFGLNGRLGNQRVQYMHIGLAIK